MLVAFSISCVYLDLSVVSIMIVALLLLIPGRLSAYFLRDLLRSRRHIDAREYENSIAAAKRFLTSLDQQPWRQGFVFFSFCFYTWSARAMALNNIGAAEMELGRLEVAKTHLARSLALDDAYPIPYYNLAVIASVCGDQERSDRMMSTAQQLGYSGGALDKAIARVGAVCARVQS